MSPEFHSPVLVSEILQSLITGRDGLYLDATVGGGGHAAAILSGLSERGRLIGLDRDPAAIRVAAESLRRYGDRVTLRQGVFWQLGALLRDLNIREIDGILFDLGVSSHQIDDPDRGFSYRHDGPLDMRMGEGDRSAWHLVNTAPYQDLLRIFRDYGEERRAAPIARAICARREQGPILRTGELAALIRSIIPPDLPQKTLSRIFQAIRIEVNAEIEHLPEALRQAVEALRVGGRVGVMSYHSIEDRTVKTAFAEWVRGCICPPGFPVCRCGRRSTLKFILGRRGVKPGSEEIAQNPRARSAVLRVAEKI